MSDDVLFEFLREALDTASQLKLKARREVNPGLTYVSFWRELERELGKDLTVYARREWEKVSLRGVKRLDQFAWRNFTSEFEFKLSQVGDATDREVEERLMDELPGELRRGLKEELLRQRSGQHCVKILEPLPLAPPMMQTMLSRVLRREIRMENFQGAYIVDCGSADGRDALRALDGWSAAGGCLRVLPHEKKIPLSEMFHWVALRLQILEGEEKYSQGIHRLELSEATMQVVGAPRAPPGVKTPGKSPRASPPRESRAGSQRVPGLKGSQRRGNPRAGAGLTRPGTAHGPRGERAARERGPPGPLRLAETSVAKAKEFFGSHIVLPARTMDYRPTTTIGRARTGCRDRSITTSPVEGVAPERGLWSARRAYLRPMAGGPPTQWEPPRAAQPMVV